MPIDTAAKRSSALMVSLPWRSRLPFPDGTIGQLDRQHVAYMYAGIAAGAAVATTKLRPIAPIVRRRRNRRPVWLLPLLLPGLMCRRVEA